MVVMPDASEIGSRVSLSHAAEASGSKTVSRLVAIVPLLPRRLAANGAIGVGADEDQVLR